MEDIHKLSHNLNIYKYRYTYKERNKMINYLTKYPFDNDSKKTFIIF